MVYRFNYCISFPYTQCSRLNGSGNCGRRAGGLDSVCTGMREMSSQPHTCLAWRPWTTETNQKRQGWWENGEKRVWPLFQRWPQNITAGKWLIAGKRNKRYLVALIAMVYSFILKRHIYLWKRQDAIMNFYKGWLPHLKTHAYAPDMCFNMDDIC